MWEKSIFIADTHGDLVCPDAVKVVKQFIEDWKPKHRIHLGDVWDFRALRKGASPEERMEGISYDYSCGVELLNCLTGIDLTTFVWATMITGFGGLLKSVAMGF